MAWLDEVLKAAVAELNRVEKAEALTLEEVRMAFRSHDIACQLEALCLLAKDFMKGTKQTTQAMVLGNDPNKPEVTVVVLTGDVAAEISVLAHALAKQYKGDAAKQSAGMAEALKASFAAKGVVEDPSNPPMPDAAKAPDPAQPKRPKACGNCTVPGCSQERMDAHAETMKSFGL